MGPTRHFDHNMKLQYLWHLQDYWKIPRRPEALRWALGLANKGDTVLLLGKGHEQSIVGPQGAVPYDEESEARKALQEQGWKA